MPINTKLRKSCWKNIKKLSNSKMFIHNEYSQPSNASTSFIDFISSLNFSTVYQDELNNSQSKIFKVGDMKYKVESPSSDVELFESSMEKKNDSLNPNVESPQDFNTEKLDGPPFFQLNVTPIQADAFIAQLPVHLYSFIKELVTIVKTYNQHTQNIDYNFKFRQLNLEVIFKQSEDMLKIIIKVGDDKLQQDLSKERQDVMKHILNHKLEMDNIELEFDFISDPTNKDSKDGQSDNPSDSHTKNQEQSEVQDLDDL